MYNIVRISSKRTTQDLPQSLEEPSESNQASFTEPLLSSKEYGILEDNADQYALPCTISQQDSKVLHLIIKLHCLMLSDCVYVLQYHSSLFCCQIVSHFMLRDYQSRLLIHQLIKFGCTVHIDSLINYMLLAM